VAIKTNTSSAFVLVLVLLPFLLIGSLLSRCDQSSDESKDLSSETNTISTVVETDSNSETTPTITFIDKEMMIMQLETLGLTNAEAAEMQKIFENVGITKIWNISEFIQGSGIDGEQGFYCDFYGFNVKRDSIRLDFEIVKRKLRTIAISWARGKNYPEINKYRDLKLLDDVKESDYGSYVFLYRKKLNNCAVDENSVGYRAIYNFETHSVSKYK
jgi:hypothetical protein